jgi:capsule polysaccharide export protein KpsE/RkpR
MSIDKHLEARGVHLGDDNTLPLGFRTQKTVRRVSAAIRAAEGEFNDELKDANDRCRAAQAKVIELQEVLRQANEELRKYRVKDTMESIDSLTNADRRKLLEVS